MKKNFTLLLSLIAWVSLGQTTTVFGAVVVNPKFFSHASAPSSATLASGLGANIGNRSFSQMAVSQLTSNASAGLSNLYDTINKGENHVIVSNVADITAKGLTKINNAQGVSTSSVENGSNTGPINLTNNTASAIGSYLSTGVADSITGLPTQILGNKNATNTGGAVITGITTGLKNSVQANASLVSNSRASSSKQPSNDLAYTFPQSQTTTAVLTPGGMSQVINAMPPSALTIAMNESSAYNTGLNSGTTTGLASAIGSILNQNNISTVTNSGAVALNNLTTHSSGGVIGGAVIGGVGNHASNVLQTLNNNG